MTVIVRRTKREVVEEIEFSDAFDAPDHFSTPPKRIYGATLAEKAKRLIEEARKPILLPDLRGAK